MPKYRVIGVFERVEVYEVEAENAALAPEQILQSIPKTITTIPKEVHVEHADGSVISNLELNDFMHNLSHQLKKIDEHRKALRQIEILHETSDFMIQNTVNTWLMLHKHFTIVNVTVSATQQGFCATILYEGRTE